ncbi:MAG: sulfite exporter TauE/SafE family protein, partial [Chloroflexota bacterium]
RLDQHVVLASLGIFLIIYSLYSLFNLRLPPIQRPVWGFGFGFASGVLGGAYNTAGPPLVIYGTALGWKPEQFKANMQALFMVGNVLAITIHIATGHVDTLVIENLLFSLPVVGIGAGIGFWLSHRVNEKLFRKAVLVALLLIGVRLLLP